jgi:hypothetical protein
VSGLCFSIFDFVLLDLEYFLLKSTVRVLLATTQIRVLFGLTVGGSSRSAAPSVAAGAGSSFIFGSVLCTDHRSVCLLRCPVAEFPTQCFCLFSSCVTPPRKGLSFPSLRSARQQSDRPSQFARVEAQL